MAFLAGHMAKFAPHMGDPHGDPQTSPQHADPHGLGAFLMKTSVTLFDEKTLSLDF